MLAIRGIDKRFFAGTLDEKHALKGVDLTLNEGDFCCVIGSNGAGKSTLLNGVAGKIIPDKGSIRIDDRDVTAMPVHRRSRWVARVFQDPMLGTAPEMTIAENMLMAELRPRPARFTLGLSPTRRDAYRERLRTLRLGLEDRLDAKVSLLSGGQRQSLSLLMAVMARPRILLLDEHTAALDPRTAQLVLDITLDAVERNKLTALMVTHDMDMAIRCGNRLVMMEAGQIIYSTSGEAKRQHTVSDLIDRFHTKDDKILLAS
ncbi:ATP-binding cassette domain-containing protein [Bradyrhizobium sp. IC3069]|uniref:ABC transporter ATP-binding protein n=1 Tax=Bradyrhizobium TaxID=374 RepID=UPI001CD19FC3|nr:MULTISPECIES: ATP-binding cassette domain-containing protein [Bradyrhizobium]MCA1365370.1 ATP-binding cassette domain-containing protein [Bradyrhizobium sp. IC4059]MCA1522869.1 ATP-binding cassette domain-containing protein [Bradyrhizobium sp. IC3069]MCA1529416.1 ATP-binding cassette domain-containing protein [Bradyrhizobium yuanmingense]MCA1550103.1 ATP-binding cassette domain-containing protein [Bradyrhizobium sp. BRP19]